MLGIDIMVSLFLLTSLSLVAKVPQASYSLASLAFNSIVKPV